MKGRAMTSEILFSGKVFWLKGPGHLRKMMLRSRKSRTSLPVFIPEGIGIREFINPLMPLADVVETRHPTAATKYWD